MLVHTCSPSNPILLSSYPQKEGSDLYTRNTASNCARVSSGLFQQASLNFLLAPTFNSNTTYVLVRTYIHTYCAGYTASQKRQKGLFCYLPDLIVLEKDRLSRSPMCIKCIHPGSEVIFWWKDLSLKM